MVKRIVFLGLSLLIAVCGAIPPSVARISEQLQALDVRLEEIRTAPVMQSRDAALVEEYFLFMIRQNPSIHTMVRIDPDGNVLNLVNGSGASRRAVSVAGERWFSRLCRTKQPYNGTAREKNGQRLLFCAWPIVESAGPAERMSGVFSVKIDVHKYLKPLLENETDPLMVLYQGSALFSRNWSAETGYLEEPLNRSGFEGLSVRYKKPESGLSVQPVSSETEAGGSPANTIQYSENRQAPENVAAPEEKKAAASTAPAVPDSPPVPASGVSPYSGRLLRSGMIAGTAVVLIGIISFVLIIRSRRRQRNETDRRKTCRNEPFEAILLDDELSALSAGSTLDPAASETRILDECPGLESETRKLPVLQEFMGESSKKQCEHEYKTDPGVRNAPEQIQEDLRVWVRSEFCHLSQRLTQVSETIQEYENTGGNSDELRELRHEIGKIMIEIGMLEKKLPREMVTPKR